MTSTANLAFLPAELQDNIIQRCRQEDLSSIRTTCKSLERATCDLFGAAFFQTRVCNLDYWSCRDLITICCNHVFGKFVRIILVETSYPSSDAMSDADSVFAAEAFTWIFRTLERRGQSPLTIGTCSRHWEPFQAREVESMNILLEAALRSRITLCGLCMKIGHRHRNVYNMAMTLMEHEEKPAFTRMIRGLKHLEMQSDTGFHDDDYQELWDTLTKAAQVESMRLVTTNSNFHFYDRVRLMYMHRYGGTVLTFPNLRRICLGLHKISLESLKIFLGSHVHIQELELQHIAFDTQERRYDTRIDLFDQIANHMVNLERFDIGAFDEFRTKSYLDPLEELLYSHISEPVVLVGREQVDQGLRELGARVDVSPPALCMRLRWQRS